MRRIVGLALLASLSSAVACQTASPAPHENRHKAPPVETTSEEIIAGTVDNDNDAVVAILLYDGNGDNQGACSGTIIAKNGTTGYVLTAGHCAASDYIIIQADDWIDCVDGDNFLDPSLPGCGEIYEANDDNLHPDWSDDYFGDGSNIPAPDFLLLRFPGANANTPVIPADDGSANFGPGDEVEFSGYGLMNQGGNLVDTTQRRHAFNEINDIYSDPPIFDWAQSFGGPGGTCQGDSGGPSIHNGYVVGVTSFGGQGCNSDGAAAHVQQVYADFIAPYIGAEVPEPTCNECAGATLSAECSAEYDACAANAQCSNILECGSTCETDPCFQDCVDENASGIDLYNAMVTCAFCGSCDATCNADFCDDPGTTSAGPGPSSSAADTGAGPGVTSGAGAGTPTSAGAGTPTTATGTGTGTAQGGDGGANGGDGDGDGDKGGGKGGDGATADEDDGCSVGAAGAPAPGGLWALGLAGLALAAATRRRRG